MKRLASTQLYIEITSKIISDIRNIIFSGNSLYKVIDRKIDWLRSRKTTQQFFSLIKEMLDDHTRLQYKKINEYLLKKFEYKKDTFYVVNQFINNYLICFGQIIILKILLIIIIFLFKIIKI